MPIQTTCGQSPYRLLVTAGPTAEDIDAVRYITNRSTGRMGLEVAMAAMARGWPTLLILGPTHLTPPDGIDVIRIRSAAEMKTAVLENLTNFDILVMTAAVADYTPAEPIKGKLKKTSGDLTLRLKRTADILAEVAMHPSRPGKIIAGFSLGASMELDEGWRKLRSKDLDLIVVNAVASFAGENTRAHILTRGGESLDCGDVSKRRLAELILDEVSR